MGGSSSNSSGSTEAPTLQLLGQEDAEYMKLKTAAIIVSICNGSTYDGLFTSVKQKSFEGTKTLVCSGNATSVNLLLEGFQGKSNNETVHRLFKEIAVLEPDCVVFNWECCSGYAGESFPEGKDKVMKLLDFILKGKHMAMFSDFSLKALIACWDGQVLGPNPFKKMSSEFDSTVQLRFDPGTLRQSPSAQLQSVGDLSEGGLCNVHCLGGTIVYSLNKSNTDHNKYKLYKGAAGHILLTYPSGGKLLTSMTHWVELVKVDTTEQKLFDMAQKQYGEQEVSKLRNEMKSMSESAKMDYIQTSAQAYVQTSAPCNNFVQKAAYKQYKS